MSTTKTKKSGWGVATWILLTLNILLLISVSYFYYTEKKLQEINAAELSKVKQDKELVIESLEILNEEKKALEKKLDEAPTKAIENYLKKQQELANDEVVKAFNGLNYPVVGIASTGISNKRIKNLLARDPNSDSWTVEEEGLSQIKEILDDSPLMTGKLRNPKNVEAFYESNKTALKALLLISKKMQKVYADAGIIANHLSGNISHQRKKALDEYFKAHDGQGGKWLLWRYYDFDDEMKKDSTLTKLMAVYGNSKKISNKHYLYYLSAKRKRACFGDEWCKTVAKVLRDFGEVK